MTAFNYPLLWNSCSLWFFKLQISSTFLPWIFYLPHLLSISLLCIRVVEKEMWHSAFKRLTFAESFQCIKYCSQCLINIQFSSVAQSCPLFRTPWTTGHQASLSITNSWSLLKLMPSELVMPSNHLIFCHPLLLLPSIFPSIKVFSNESALHIRWPKYWSFSFNISPSNVHSGLISFRLVGSPCSARDSQESSPTSKSINFFFFNSSKASILWCSAFFMLQLSHPYMTTGKTIALTRRNFAGKVTSLLFNILPRLVIAFLPRSKSLLTSWLQSSSAVILEPKGNQS